MSLGLYARFMQPFWIFRSKLSIKRRVRRKSAVEIIEQIESVRQTMLSYERTEQRREAEICATYIKALQWVIGDHTEN